MKVAKAWLSIALSLYLMIKVIQAIAITVDIQGFIIIAIFRLVVITRAVIAATLSALTFVATRSAITAREVTTVVANIACSIIVTITIVVVIKVGLIIMNIALGHLHLSQIPLQHNPHLLDGGLDIDLLIWLDCH